MKQIQKLLFLPLILLIFTACGAEKAENIPVTPGHYTQDVEHNTKETWFPATLTLEEDGTFRFSFDLLSSYGNFGDYTQEEDVVTCTTHDGRYTFRFQVLAEDRLAFLKEGSSPVTYFDTYFATPVTDLMEFVRIEERE